MSARISLEDHIAAHRASVVPAQKPRAKRKRKALMGPEDLLHVAIAKYLSAVIARPGVCSPLGVIWYSVETRARRSTGEGNRNKQRGCVSGCPDIDIYFAGRAFKIELKAKNGSLSDNQEDLHIELARAKVAVIEARTLDQVAAVLVTWGIPHRKATL